MVVLEVAEEEEEKALSEEEEEEKATVLETASDDDSYVPRTLVDPRGYQPFLSEVPQGYCPDCRMPRDRCHDKVFGGYVECRVTEHLSVHANRLEEIDILEVEDVQVMAYNEVLRVKIYDVMLILDTCTRYLPPMCLQNRTMNRSLHSFKYRILWCAQHAILQNGEELGSVMEYNRIIRERTF